MRNDVSDLITRSRFKNKNGFSQPMTFQQSVPVLIVVLNLTELIYIYTSVNDLRTLKTVLSLTLCIVTFVVVLSLWLRATLLDPTDSVQQRHYDCLLNNIQIDKSSRKYNCGICKTFVSEHSFHCSRCNRCVELFDHHCKWINNCVGGKNYFAFLGLVMASLAFLIQVTVFNLILLVNETVIMRLAFQCTVLAVDIVPILALLYLVLLHFYLLIRKKSTIGLILERRKLRIHAEENDNKTVAPTNMGQSTQSQQSNKQQSLLVTGLAERKKIIETKRKLSRTNKLAALPPSTVKHQLPSQCLEMAQAVESTTPIVHLQTSPPPV